MDAIGNEAADKVCDISLAYTEHEAQDVLKADLSNP